MLRSTRGVQRLSPRNGGEGQAGALAQHTCALRALLSTAYAHWRRARAAARAAGVLARSLSDNAPSARDPSARSACAARWQAAAAAVRGTQGSGAINA